MYFQLLLWRRAHRSRHTVPIATLRRVFGPRLPRQTCPESSCAGKPRSAVRRAAVPPGRRRPPWGVPSFSRGTRGRPLPPGLPRRPCDRGEVGGGAWRRAECGKGAPGGARRTGGVSSGGRRGRRGASLRECGADVGSRRQGGCESPLCVCEWEGGRGVTRGRGCPSVLRSLQHEADGVLNRCFHSWTRLVGAEESPAGTCFAPAACF